MLVDELVLLLWVNMFYHLLGAVLSWMTQQRRIVVEPNDPVM
jgi:hypothetical protein